MLKNKRILFLAPDFFNYPKLITTALISSGASVNLFYNHPSDQVFKIASVLNKKLSEKIEARYFRALQNKITGFYHYILIIRCDIIPEKFMNQLKETNPGSVFINYLWDDISLIPSLLDSFRYFDRILSYNIHDCKKYGLVFRPFFFVQNDKPDRQKNSKRFDLFFIGIFHTDRFEVIDKVRKLNPGLKLYLHFYINPITFLKKGFAPDLLKLFSFTKMSYHAMVRMIQRSCAILDLPKPSQHGLTTRIFEALGAEVKVITTNEEVRDYEFFNESNFLIIDRTSPVIDRAWITSPFRIYDDCTLSKYHIKDWIKDIFDFENNSRNWMSV